MRPYVNERNVSPDATTEFRGLNHELSCPDGQFYDMMNMSGDNYPMLSTRHKRGYTFFDDGIYTMTPVEILHNGEILKCMAGVKHTNWDDPVSEVTITRIRTGGNSYAYVAEDINETDEGIDAQVIFIYGDPEEKDKEYKFTINQITKNGNNTILQFYDNNAPTFSGMNIPARIETGTFIRFFDSNGDRIEDVYVDKRQETADNTRLIVQAGYLYVFPQGVRIPLLTEDKTPEKLGTVNEIQNNTTPGEGGYSSESYNEWNLNKWNDYFSKGQTGFFNDQTHWQRVNSRTLWFNAFVLRNLSDSGDVTAGYVVESIYYSSEDNRTPMFDDEDWWDTHAIVTSHDAGLWGSVWVGDKVTVDTSTLTNSIKVYKPEKEPWVEAVMIPSDAEGMPFTDGSKAETTANKTMTDNYTLTNNELIIFTGGQAENDYSMYSAAVGSDGIVTDIKDGQGIAVPSGGFVLSGTGQFRSFIKWNISVGNYIVLDELNIKVYQSKESNVVTQKPETPENGMRWYDDVTGSIYVYSSASEAWMPAANNYILFEIRGHSIVVSGETVEPVIDFSVNGETSESFTELISAGDAIDIKGFSDDFDGSYIVHKVNESSLILEGVITRNVSEILPSGGKITLRRQIPEMDHVIECGNRLWGCRYGVDSDGKVINEIYASALGDPRNFYKYQGISTDSWTATIGVPGEWTGAVKYGDYPLFFKDDAIIRVYGTSPSSYQTACYRYRGVKYGSSKSPCIVNEVLYYHSRDGVLAFTGGAPQKIDKALGRETYRDAVSGSLDGKLYISMVGEDGVRTLFTYDTRYGLWHKEDDAPIAEMIKDSDILYFLRSDNTVIASHGDDEDDFQWEAETGTYGFGDVFKKRLEKVRVKAILPHSSRMEILCSYDYKPFESVKEVVGDDSGIIDLSFVPTRCEAFRLKFRGVGECRIITVYRETSYGGDR